MPTRRAVLTGLTASLAALALARPAWAAPTPLRILILGGTGFLGPHMVRHALARGHVVTLFNRGRTNPHLFPEVERIQGDRDGGLKGLKKGRWDVVIDNSGYVPRVVGDSAKLLAKRADHYLFTSTISVYADHDVPGADESAPVAVLEEPTEEVDGVSYGPLKALCEQAVADAFGEARSTIVRPCLIVGPGDPTDRFTYWPARLARGGEVLCPGDGLDPVQIIDVRDLAEWSIRLVEQRVAGTFNGAGLADELRMEELLGACKAMTALPTRLTWADGDWLAEQGVQMWQHMPSWIDRHTEGMAGAALWSNAAAVEAGLTFRPLAETLQATLAWWQEQPEERRAQVRAGLPAEREQEVLAAWHART